MTILVLDGALVLQAELALFSSFRFTRSFFGVGDFELHAHPCAPGAAALSVGTVLVPEGWSGGGTVGGVVERAGFVVEDVTRNDEEVVARGVQLKGLAKRRVCVPPLANPAALSVWDGSAWQVVTDAAEIAALMAGDVWQGYAAPESPTVGMAFLDLSGQAAVYDWEANAGLGAVWLDLETAQLRQKYKNFGWDRVTLPAESAILHYLANNVTAPEDAARAMAGVVLSADQARGDTLPWQARFDKLHELLQAIGEATGVGWDIVPDLATREMVAGARVGRDLSGASGGGAVTISLAMGNASRVERKQATSASATVVYAGGAGQDENRMILGVAEDADAMPAGFLRREAWAEAGSVSDAEMLRMFGRTKLTALAAKDTLTAELLDAGACQYGRDFLLGDVVRVSGADAEMNARITAVTEVYEGDRPRGLQVTFGDAPLTLTGRLSAEGRAGVR